MKPLTSEEEALLIKLQQRKEEYRVETVHCVNTIWAHITDDEGNLQADKMVANAKQIRELLAPYDEAPVMLGEFVPLSVDGVRVVNVTTLHDADGPKSVAGEPENDERNMLRAKHAKRVYEALCACGHTVWKGERLVSHEGAVVYGLRCAGCGKFSPATDQKLNNKTLTIFNEPPVTCCYRTPSSPLHTWQINRPGGNYAVGGVCTTCGNTWTPAPR